MTDKIFKVDWNPEQSDLKDIYGHPIARSLWAMYKANHMISQNGLPFLNDICRELIKTGDVMSVEAAHEFLKGFMRRMNHVEHSMGVFDNEFIEQMIPFMTGESVVKLEYVPNGK